MEIDVIKKLDEFESEIKEQESKLTTLKNKRISWAKENRKSIKLLYPKKDKILYYIS